MARRIDSLTPGEKVSLKIHNSAANEGYVLNDVTFTGIRGEGDKREAVFGDFAIYRFNGRWAIASDARKVSLLT